MTDTGSTVHSGICRCGCGRQTKISTRTRRDRGATNGEYLPFIRGHYRRPKPARFNGEHFKIDGVYCKLIPLTQGQYAIVDETDFEWLSRWKWHACWSSCTGTYYADRGTSKTGNIRMHREILGLPRGDNRQVDHREPGNTVDNRRKNIRIATRSQNQANIRVHKASASKLKGAHFNKRRDRWYSTITVSGKRIYLGSARSARVAHELYCSAARKYFGEFSRAA